MKMAGTQRCICSRKCRITQEPGAQFPKGGGEERCLCGVLHLGSREGIRGRLVPWREPCVPTLASEEWADTQHTWQLKSLVFGKEESSSPYQASCLTKQAFLGGPYLSLSHGPTHFLQHPVPTHQQLPALPPVLKLLTCIFTPWF